MTLFVAVTMIVMAAAALAAYLLMPAGLTVRGALGKQFVGLPLPSDHTRELFDVVIMDVNGDDRLDIGSTNHNSREILWVGDGLGGFRDMRTALALDQDQSFPGAEISDIAPEITEPGVYIYWEIRNDQSHFPLVIRTHRLREAGTLEGGLQSYSSFRSFEADVFTVQPPATHTEREGEMPRNVMNFRADRDGVLKVIVTSPGVPVSVRLDRSFPLAKVYVGQQKVNPRGNDFTLAFQDRHGMAWSDYNDDGRLDAFISRGAIGGTLRLFPPSFQERIQDELLVSGPDGRYVDSRSSAGIEKRGCSGRKVTWVDFERDGMLDLFVNCMERGQVGGRYPKQFYRQSADRSFADVAEQVGLSLAEHEVIDFVWFDADGDGYTDLVTYESKGYFLYRNLGGKRFAEQFLGRGQFVRADRPQLRGTSDEYWFVDGKLAVSDFDGDGDLDVFSASKTGNNLLLNDGKGGLSLVDLASRGLPEASATANWVDFDNDGLLDLFAVPDGLFRQKADGHFESTGLLALPTRKYMAAIANWADLDNDGRRDLVLAVLENFSFWNWWDKLHKANADRFKWDLAAYRNVGESNHWLALRLVGRPGNPQAIGARVSVRTAARQQTQVVGLSDGAFFSQGHYRLNFGLGASNRVDSIQVLWPDGQVQDFADLQADRLHVIEQTAMARPGATK